MNDRGPVITLFAVAALAVVLVGFNVTTTSQTATPSPVAVPADAPAPNDVAAPPPQASLPEASPPEAPPAPQEVPPAPQEVPQQASYAGRTSGNEATIAIAVRDDQATAYVCDGRQVESWLRGTIVDGQFSAENARGDRATGTVEGDAIFGTVSVNDEQWPYAARLASPPAGLYEGSATVNGSPNRVGWIVLEDGSQVGVWNNNGVPKPAPRLDPTTLRSVTIGGIRINPQRVAGDS